ncbi:MAG: carboxymuconolactone decarboxylase family protein [Planctomycetes bacterium]|nr:carboxymuconolactone decarboxylase family protein [Planctomycetota bacterium]MCH9725839.1 carboxymuconolactone decarboxylase family protein [Planctomycetota bacterium]MCH9775403.1 carboxymuconolactone decarboxylase family protein [Planctomycetota bacterium]MCH9790276.1 carboxymuconolactone decarboxylase family protein [Planctomycetota bacterium]
MQRLNSVSPETAEGKAKTLLDGVKAKLGITPNIMKTMANSPAVLDAYLKFSGSLGSGELTAANREQIALNVSEFNQCGYCLAAHSAIGESLGLTEEEIQSNRSGTDSDEKTKALMNLSRKIVEKRGFVSDQDIQEFRDAGYGDAEITEVVANVALNIFTNYFNHLAQTEVDFPEAKPLVDHPATACATEGGACCH